MKGESSAVRTIFRVWKKGVEEEERGRKGVSCRDGPLRLASSGLANPRTVSSTSGPAVLPPGDPRESSGHRSALAGGSHELCPSAPFSHLLPPSMPTHLGLNVKDGDLVLLVDLVHCFKFGAKHVALVAAKLQELVGSDAPRHLRCGDEVVLLPVFFTLLGRPCRICAREPKSLSNSGPPGLPRARTLASPPPPQLRLAHGVSWRGASHRTPRG